MRQDLAFLDLLSASPSTIYNTGSLGTTPFRFANAASSSSPNVGVRLLQITNKSTAAYVAFVPSPSTASPTFVASAAGVVAATEGINIGPGSSYFLNVKNTIDIWLVASAISTALQVVAYDKTVR